MLLLTNLSSMESDLKSRLADILTNDATFIEKLTNHVNVTTPILKDVESVVDKALEQLVEHKNQTTVSLQAIQIAGGFRIGQ